MLLTKRFLSVRLEEECCMMFTGTEIGEQDWMFEEQVKLFQEPFHCRHSSTIKAPQIAPAVMESPLISIDICIACWRCYRRVVIGSDFSIQHWHHLTIYLSTSERKLGSMDLAGRNWFPSCDIQFRRILFQRDIITTPKRVWWLKAQFRATLVLSSFVDLKYIMNHEVLIIQIQIFFL